MKILSCALLLMASIAFAMLGCSDTPESVVASNGQPTTSSLAKSIVFHSRIEIPVDYTSPDPAGCLPGLVHVTGFVAVVVQVVSDANGELKLSAMHANVTHLTLTTESGLVYNINEIDKEQYTYGGANTMSYFQHGMVVGPSANLRIHATIKIRLTITPNGDVRGNLETISFECE